MSLDIMLVNTVGNCKCTCCGHIHKVQSPVTVFDINVTHNLNLMADAAQLYNPLWHPERVPASKAGELIEPLTQGLQILICDEESLQKHAPANKWGTWDNLKCVTEKYLEACKQWPDAEILIHR